MTIVNLATRRQDHWRVFGTPRTARRSDQRPAAPSLLRRLAGVLVGPAIGPGDSARLDLELRLRGQRPPRRDGLPRTS